MPPTIKVVVAHLVGEGLRRDEPEASTGGTLMYVGAIARCAVGIGTEGRSRSGLTEMAEKAAKDFLFRVSWFIIMYMYIYAARGSQLADATT
jgi:hypothetical protein